MAWASSANSEWSKTLSPHMFGDDWYAPWRTRILMRAWAFWRCRCFGWAASIPSRAREAMRMSQNIVRDLRSAHRGVAASPVLGVLGGTQAHTLLAKWAPVELAASMQPDVPA